MLSLATLRYLDKARLPGYLEKVARHAVPASAVLLQYWRPLKDLEKFARDPNDPHLPAWRRFNRQARASGDVGIWHETYLIAPGDYRSVYSNMPSFGLARATDHRPVRNRS